MWKVTYGLARVKVGEQEPIKVKDDEEDDDNKDIVKEDIEMKVDNQETTKAEQQEEQSVQDTQLSDVKPQNVTSVNTKTIIVKDVSDHISQNINPLTKEDLKKILDQSTLQAKLCDNLVLVSVDELQKIVTDSTMKEVNTQRPPTITPQVTNVQPLDKIP